MRLLILLLILLLVNKNVSSQHTVWTKQIAGAAQSIGSGIVTDTFGNVYSTGSFSGSIDINPDSGITQIIGSFGLQDIFIQKLDSNGKLIWSQTIGDLGYDEATAIALDNSGNIYITGIFSASVDFDPGQGVAGLTSAGGFDIFVLKLDNSGNFVWAKQVSGSASSDRSMSIAVDGSSNVYVTGYFGETADFDPGTASHNLTTSGTTSDADAFIWKLDANGNLALAIQIGNNKRDMGSSIAVNTSGHIFVAGAFSGTVDFDPGAGVHNLTSNGPDDQFITKYDATGKLIWARQIGGKAGETLPKMTIDATSNVYTIGGYKDTVDFDPGTGVHKLIAPTTNNMIVVLKLSSAGVFAWATHLGGVMTVEDIHTDRLNNVYTTGSFSQADNMLSAGQQDMFIVKLDNAGKYIWGMRGGGNAIDRSIAITIDSKDNIYSIGEFRTTAKFDLSTGSTTLTAQDADAYIWKISPNTLGISQVANTDFFKVYPNPITDKLIIESALKNATFHLFDILGREVLSGTINHTKEQIELPQLQRGTYVLQVKTIDGLRISKTILKE